jgi:hypothetical protein
MGRGGEKYAEQINGIGKECNRKRGRRETLDSVYRKIKITRLKCEGIITVA